MAHSSPLPSLRDLRAAAKALLAACRSGDASSLARHAAAWPRGEPPTLQRCLHTIAREHGATSWNDLVAAATTQASPTSTASPGGLDPRPALAAIRAQSDALLAMVPSVADGGTLGIIGQSACGKSFLAKRILLAHLLAGADVVICLPWVVDDIQVGDRAMHHALGLTAVARFLGRQVSVGHRLVAGAHLQVLLPDPDVDQDPFHTMPGLIAAVDAGLAAGHLRPGTVVYLDEVGARHRFQEFATRMVGAGCQVIATCQLVTDLEDVPTWTEGRRLRVVFGSSAGSQHQMGGLAACPRQPRGVFSRTEIAHGQQTAPWEPLGLPVPDLVSCWLLTELYPDLTHLAACLREDPAGDVLQVALRLAASGRSTERRQAYANHPIPVVRPLPDLVVGAAVWFASETEPYTVQARNDAFIICTRPIPGESELTYTVIDVEEGFRGTDGFVFPLDYTTREACQRSLEQIDGISHRNRVRIDIRRVEAPAGLADGRPSTSGG